MKNVPGGGVGRATVPADRFPQLPFITLSTALVVTAW